MDDEALLGKGVAALGARRKLLKVFDQVKAHCLTNVSLYIYTCIIRLIIIIEYYLLIVMYSRCMKSHYF